MQGGLFGREFNRDRFRFAHGEVADVAPAGAVDQWRKCIEFFQLPDERQAVGRIVVVGIEQIIG